jgi:hypothetical protein
VGDDLGGADVEAAGAEGGDGGEVDGGGEEPARFEGFDERLATTVGHEIFLPLMSAEIVALPGDGEAEGIAGVRWGGERKGLRTGEGGVGPE